MSDPRNASIEVQTKTPRSDDTRIVPAVPHIDQVDEKAPPWTIPEDHDPEAVELVDPVVPMTSVSRLAEVRDTDAPRFVRRQGSSSPGI